MNIGLVRFRWYHMISLKLLLSSSNPRPGTLYILTFYLTFFLAYTLTYSDILSDIILAYVSAISSDILSVILSGISSEILSGQGPAGPTLILSLLFGSGGDDCDHELAVEVWRRRRRRRRTARTADLKYPKIKQSSPDK